MFLMKWPLPLPDLHCYHQAYGFQPLSPRPVWGWHGGLGDVRDEAKMDKKEHPQCAILKGRVTPSDRFQTLKYRFKELCCKESSLTRPTMMCVWDCRLVNEVQGVNFAKYFSSQPDTMSWIRAQA